MFTKPVVPAGWRCHWKTVGVGEPVAATVNEVFPPGATATLTGCVVIVGAVVAPLRRIVRF